MGGLTVKGGDFYRDGEKTTLVSGTIHYFRVVPDYWEDRLKKLRGLRVQRGRDLYLLEPARAAGGRFRFLRRAGHRPLYRHGGRSRADGHPATGALHLRGVGHGRAALLAADLRAHAAAVQRSAVPREGGAVLQGAVPPCDAPAGRQRGNVVAVQVENEYGSYGDDKDYLRAIADIYRDNGVDCLLFTSDGTAPFMLGGGTLDGVLATVNFGSNPAGNFGALREFRRGEPVMCMEYWNGWFDHWYEEHHTRHLHRHGAGAGRDAERRGIGEFLHVPRGHQFRVH